MGYSEELRTPVQEGYDFTKIDGIDYEIKWSAKKNYMDFKVHYQGDLTVFLQGSVKWDGCINFLGEDHVNLHICEPKELHHWTKVMEYLVGIASTTIPDWLD